MRGRGVLGVWGERFLSHLATPPPSPMPDAQIKTATAKSVE